MLASHCLLELAIGPPFPPPPLCKVEENADAMHPKNKNKRQVEKLEKRDSRTLRIDNSTRWNFRAYVPRFRPGPSHHTMMRRRPSVPPSTLLPVTAHLAAPLSHFPCLSAMKASCRGWSPPSHLCMHA